MNLKVILLAIIVGAVSVSSQAQTARNPLNFEPAQVTLQKYVLSKNLADELIYHADGRQIDKRSINYDNNGRKTKDVVLRWNETNKSWQNLMVSEFSYEEGKKIVSNSSNRQNMSKTETVVDSNGKPVYSFTFSWDDGSDDWSVIPFMRCEWVYDTNGLATTYLKQYKNRKTNDWNAFSERILYIYKAGDLVEELFQRWNNQQEQWINGGRYCYAKESDQKIVAFSSIYVSDEWLDDGKTVYLYDGEGKITRGEYYKNSTDATFDAYSLFFYSEVSDFAAATEPKELIVYPNPVVSSFELTVPDGYAGKIMYLFDLYGNQVKTLVVQNQKTSVDVSGLSGGIYILKIDELTQRLIIK